MRPTNRYIHEYGERSGVVTSSTVVAGPLFEKLVQYHRVVGVESYASADGSGWRICVVKDPVSGEMIEGFQILSFLTTPTRQCTRTQQAG